VPAEGKDISARRGLKEAVVQTCETTSRTAYKVWSPGERVNENRSSTLHEGYHRKEDPNERNLNMLANEVKKWDD
jgi:hypothetical protein